MDTCDFRCHPLINISKWYLILTGLSIIFLRFEGWSRARQPACRSGSGSWSRARQPTCWSTCPPLILCFIRHFMWAEKSRVCWNDQQTPPAYFLIIWDNALWNLSSSPSYGTRLYELFLFLHNMEWCFMRSFLFHIIWDNALWSLSLFTAGLMPQPELPRHRCHRKCQASWSPYLLSWLLTICHRPAFLPWGNYSPV